jgi:hypothetical protein
MGLSPAEMPTERDHQECLRRVATDRRAPLGGSAVIPFPAGDGCGPGGGTALPCGLPVAFPVTPHSSPPSAMGAKILRRLRLNSSPSAQ